MNMLYESDAFVVVGWQGDEPDTAIGFEIVVKEDDQEVFLSNAAAQAFAEQIKAWQARTPHQEQVEKSLERFTRLGRLPLLMH